MIQARCKSRLGLPLALSILCSAGEAADLFWAQTSGDRISRVATDGSGTATILTWPVVDDPVALAIDFLGQKIYWAQSIGDRIGRANFDGSMTETVLEWPEVNDCTALAIDGQAGKLYWAQTFDDRILRANLDGTAIETLVQWPDVDDPVALAVDAFDGKIYWAQSFGDRILRANLDGSAVETLLEWPELDDPTALAIDPPSGKLYWSQTYGNRIFRANVDGSGAELLLEWPEVDGPVALTLDSAGGKLYWAQTFEDRISSANLDGSAPQTLLSWPEASQATALAFAPSTTSVIAKSRYITLLLPPQSGASALRVRLTSLHHPDPPNLPQFPAPNFTAFEGQVRWVGPPMDCLENEPPASTFKCALLQCAPHYANWATLLAGRPLEVTGSAIVPSSVYTVEEIPDSCAGMEDTCGTVLTTQERRTGRWGDAVPPYQLPSPAALNQPNISDVAAAVDKFKGLPNAPPKAQIQMKPNEPDPTRNVDIADVANTVDAFKNLAYPYPGPASCP